jgi:hypothetical protein
LQYDVKLRDDEIRLLHSVPFALLVRAAPHLLHRNGSVALARVPASGSPLIRGEVAHDKKEVCSRSKKEERRQFRRNQRGGPSTHSYAHTAQKTLPYTYNRYKRVFLNCLCVFGPPRRFCLELSSFFLIYELHKQASLGTTSFKFLCLVLLRAPAHA